MQKPFQQRIIGLCFLIAFACRPAIAENGAVTLEANDKNLTYFGRWDRTNSAVPRSHWGGAYLRTRFTGTSVSLKMADGQHLVVSIDGEPFRAVDGKQGVTPLNASPLPPGTHTLLVGPSTGGEARVEGLVLDPGASVKPAIPRPIIEFIGDSITWGTGPKDLWNVNWTWQTAEALNCDHTQVAQSARALTTGYGCADEKTGMHIQYFRLKNFGYATEKPPVLWDFSIYTPQIIVINLGQNDACGNEPDAVFTASYIQFIKNTRAKFPKAQIVALRMFGGGRFGTDTQKAVAVCNADGDSRVHFITTEGGLEKSDYCDGVHSNDAGNLKAALRLAPLLKPLLAMAQSPKTAGDPANPDGLAQALQNAYIRGERRIVITPGTYLLSRKGQTQIPLNRWRDATLSAYNVTLILNNEAGVGRLFMLENCRNVTLEGPLLSQTAQTAYQGRVIAIGKDEGGKPFCEWRPSVGYPVPSEATKELWINFVDAKTRAVNLQAGDYYHAKLETIGSGAYRVTLENRPVRFRVGDWIVARYGDPPNKIFLANCRDCTLKDITMTRNGFAPIFEGEGGGNHILQCHWKLGPRSAGATEDPIVANAADGIHSPDANPGPDIERCTFDGVFLDDCIAIHGGFHKILRVDGPVITAQNAYAFYGIGEPVRLSNDRGFYLQANVTAMKDNGDGTSTLTLDTAETIPLNAKLSNPLCDGHGYKIIGCRLGNTRSRGIIVKSDDGLIKDNVITRCGLAIHIGPEWPDEADYCHNVTVSGNTISDNDGGIVVDGSGAKENRDITIQDNRLGSNAAGDIRIAWADGVTITGNTITAPASLPSGSKSKPPIETRDSTNVRISGNLIKLLSKRRNSWQSAGRRSAEING